MLLGDRIHDKSGLHGHQLIAFLLCLGSTFFGQKQCCVRQWIMYSVTWQMTVLAEAWQARKQKQNQTHNNGLLQQDKLQSLPLLEGPSVIKLPPGSWMTSKGILSYWCSLVSRVGYRCQYAGQSRVTRVRRRALVRGSPYYWAHS